MKQSGITKAISTIEADFGAKTDEAVRSFQKAKKLGVDGKVGKLTREALDK